MILNLIFTFFLYQLEIIKILHFSWLALIQAGQVLLVILIFECPSLHLYVIFNIYLNYLYIIIPKHVLYLLIVSQLSLHISLSYDYWKILDRNDKILSFCSVLYILLPVSRVFLLHRRDGMGSKRPDLIPPCRLE